MTGRGIARRAIVASPRAAPPPRARTRSRGKVHRARRLSVMAYVRSSPSFTTFCARPPSPSLPPSSSTANLLPTPLLASFAQRPHAKPLATAPIGRTLPTAATAWTFEPKTSRPSSGCTITTDRWARWRWQRMVPTGQTRPRPSAAPRAMAGRPVHRHRQARSPASEMGATMAPPAAPLAPRPGPRHGRLRHPRHRRRHRRPISRRRMTRRRRTCRSPRWYRRASL
jgi:hypothetical protein